MVITSDQTHIKPSSTMIEPLRGTEINKLLHYYVSSNPPTGPQEKIFHAGHLRKSATSATPHQPCKQILARTTFQKGQEWLFQEVRLSSYIPLRHMHTRVRYVYHLVIIFDIRGDAMQIGNTESTSAANSIFNCYRQAMVMAYFYNLSTKGGIHVR